MRLTAKERILLHLLESAKSADDVEVPAALTQGGLAFGAGIELRHLIQFVRPLLAEGLVSERLAHVAGKRQRMKVYGLTPAGRAAAIRLRETVKTQVVRIRDGDAVREGSLHEALQESGVRTTLLDAARQVELAGVLDLEIARRAPESGFVEQTWDAPQVATFVGRREELAEITRENVTPRIFVVRGMAGIGKSTLAAKACGIVRGRRNIFWHRIRPWESSSTILANLGRFLQTLDRPGLSSVLKRGKPELAGEVLRQDLPDTRAFLVLDDAHEASPETLAVVRMLAESTASAPDVTLLILTRRALPFYDVRDIVIKNLVQEIELDGLGPEDTATLLTQGGDSSLPAGLGRRLAGHPLLIELVRRHRADMPTAVRDVHRFIEEAIYRELSEGERTTMKAASLYRVPVPRTTMLSIPGSSYEALVSLQDRSLIRFVGGGRYEVHDTIRDFFDSVRTPRETADFGALAVAELRSLAARSCALGDLVSGIGFLSNAARLAQRPEEGADIQERLGDAEDRIGDFPAALVAYREAMRLAEEPESVARLHRKLAAALEVRGETAPAAAEVEAALRSLGKADRVERGWISLVRARMDIAQERWSAGREHAEAAEGVFRSFGDARGRAEALIELAIVQVNSPDGNPGSASRYLVEALQLSRSIGDPALTASVHAQFANLYAYRLGDADRAMECLDAIEALPGALADVRSHQSLVMLKGWLKLDLRADFTGARSDFLEALALSGKSHDPVTAALARHGAAVAEYHAGDCLSARSQLEAVGLELLAFGYAGAAVEAFWMAAETCLVMGDLDGFRAFLSRLKEPAWTRGAEARPVMAHTLQGIDRFMARDREGVDVSFEEAIRIAEEEVSPLERSLIPFAYDLYGAVLQAMGDHALSEEQDRISVEYSRRFGLKGRLVARAKLLPGLRKSLKRMYASTAMSSAMH